MDETNPLAGASLPDGTARSQRGATGDNAPSAADLKRGYLPIDVERSSPFALDVSPENQVGDPYTYGGFLGRQRGFAR